MQCPFGIEAIDAMRKAEGVGDKKKKAHYTL